MQSRLFINRRDTHQSDGGEFEDIYRVTDEFNRVSGCYAGLLRFLSGIHFHEKFRRFSLRFPFELCLEGLRELQAVDGMNRIEEKKRVTHFVGLQRPHQMKLDVGKFTLESRPFGLGLLHTILPKEPMPGIKNRPDTLFTMAFADRDKLNLRGRCDGFGARGGDAVENRLEIIRGI